MKSFLNTIIFIKSIILYVKNRHKYSTDDEIGLPHICYRSILDRSIELGIQLQDDLEIPPPLLVAEVEVNIVHLKHKQINEKTQYFLNKIDEKCTKSISVSNKQKPFNETHVRIKLHTGDKSALFTSYHYIIYPSATEEYLVIKDFNNIASLLVSYKKNRGYIIRKFHNKNLQSRSSLALFIIFSIGRKAYDVGCMCLIIKNKWFMVHPIFPDDNVDYHRWVTVTAEVLNDGKIVHREKWMVWPCHCDHLLVYNEINIYIDGATDNQTVKLTLDYLPTQVESPNTRFEDVEKKKVEINIDEATVLNIKRSDHILNDAGNIYLVKTFSFYKRCPDQTSLVTVSATESRLSLITYVISGDTSVPGYKQYVYTPVTDTDFCHLDPFEMN